MSPTPSPSATPPCSDTTGDPYNPSTAATITTTMVPSPPSSVVHQATSFISAPSLSSSTANPAPTTPTATVTRWLPDSSAFHLSSYRSPPVPLSTIQLVPQNYCLQHKCHYALSWCPACPVKV